MLPANDWSHSPNTGILTDFGTKATPALQYEAEIRRLAKKLGRVAGQIVWMRGLRRFFVHEQLPDAPAEPNSNGASEGRWRGRRAGRGMSHQMALFAL